MDVDPNEVTIPVPPEPAAAPPAKMFTEDDLNRARQQEKDKLYARLSKVDDLEAKFASMAAEREAAEKAAADAEAARLSAEQLAERQRAEAEMSAKEYADTRHSELLSQLETIQREREQERAVFAKEREYNELQAYRTQRMQEASDQIAPELLDLVSGSSQEEIDASIGVLTERTNRILDSIQAQQGAYTPPRPVSPTGGPTTDPIGGTASKTYSVPDLQNMSMADYIKNRTQLLGAASQQFHQNRGRR